MMQASQPLWFTYNQAKKLGVDLDASKLKGKSIPICFFKFNKFEDKKTGKEKTVPMLRYYSVFNASDLVGLPEKFLQKIKEFVHNPDANAEQILATMDEKPAIEHNKSKAYYTPSTDVVSMPSKTAFEDSNEYYSTLFHELIHWTGKRLKRDMGKRFGDDQYANEELVAELGAAMLCGLCGIDNTLKNSAAYIKNWSEKLKADPKLIVQAAGKAQKAVDLILGIKFERAA